MQRYGSRNRRGISVSSLNPARPPDRLKLRHPRQRHVVAPVIVYFREPKEAR